MACFNTYNRLPFGVSSAPGVFQRVMESILSGNPNVVVYIDDILVTGPNALGSIGRSPEMTSRSRTKFEKRQMHFYGTISSLSWTQN